MWGTPHAEMSWGLGHTYASAVRAKWKGLRIAGGVGGSRAGPLAAGRSVGRLARNSALGVKVLPGAASYQTKRNETKRKTHF